MKSTFKKKATISYVTLGSFIALVFSMISYFSVNYIEHDLEQNSNYQHALLLSDIFHNQKEFMTYNTDRFVLYSLKDGEEGNVPKVLKEITDTNIEITYNNHDYEFIRVNKENSTYYFLFDIENFETLENYTFTLLAVSFIISIVISFFVGKSLSSQLTIPIEKLAGEILSHKNSSKNTLSLSQEFDDTIELDILSKALIEYSENLERIIQREKSFSAHISHEFRTPISVILGAIEILESDASEFSEKNISLLKRLTHEMYQLRDIVEMMLLLAKLDRSNQFLIPLETVNVNDIVKKTMSSLVQQFKFKKIHVNYIENTQVSHSAWKVALSVIIRNILHNAYSYTAHGEILIELTDEYLSIKDSGLGVFNNNSSFAGNLEGEFHCGIGLKLCTELATYQNFKLIVQERNDASGTVATIYFN